MKGFINATLTLTCLAFVLVSGCAKQDDTYRQFLEDGEVVYVGKADSVQVFPGKNRLKLSWLVLADPNASKAKVFWNNHSDSLEVPFIKSSGIDTIEIVIPGLEEGTYQFEIYTYDKAGNSSIKVTTDGEVFGDSYIVSLLNRPIDVLFLDNNKLNIRWYPADEGSLGTEFRYIAQSGDERTLFINSEDSITVPVGFSMGTAFKYRTLYLPDTLSIDTFYAEFTTVEPALIHKVNEELESEKFLEFPLPGDAEAASYQGNTLANLWSGVKEGSVAEGAWYRTSNGSGIPHHFQFDLGVTAKLNHLVIWQRGAFDQQSLLFNSGNLRKWEIWGSNEPAGNGSYENWIKLLSCESVKPSGLPKGKKNSDDIDYAQQGELFTFPEDSPDVRYIRIKVLETWGESDYMFASDLELYGSYWVIE